MFFLAGSLSFSPLTVNLHWLFFFLVFFFNFILFLNFTILYYFCQISKWIHHRYTCVPHPEPSSLIPPHTIPLGRPSAPAPSNQYRASNLDWQLVSWCIEQSYGLCRRRRGWEDLGERHWNMYNIVYETVASPGLMHWLFFSPTAQLLSCFVLFCFSHKLGIPSPLFSFGPFLSRTLLSLSLFFFVCVWLTALFWWSTSCSIFLTKCPWQ